MKVRGIIQARMTSKRFRGKSLVPLAGKPLLARVLDRVQKMPFVDEVVVATSLDAADDPIVAFAESLGSACFRGDRENVLDRFLGATADLSVDDCLVRYTADNPLYDVELSTEAWKEHTKGSWDYTYIDGLSPHVPEFVRVRALRTAATGAEGPWDREHVTPVFRRCRDRFRVQVLSPQLHGLRPHLNKHFTVDRRDQLEMLELMLADLERHGTSPSLADCYVWIDSKMPDLEGAAPSHPGDKRISIAGRPVGDGCPCFVVADIGQNHNGQMNMAKRLIEMAARCDVDAVKFQKRDIQCELTADAYNRPYENPNSFGRTYGEHRESLEFSKEQHLELKEYAQAYGLVCFCTACDPPSVEAMEHVGNPAYKVASRDITNLPLLEVIAETGKPVILSTGMAGKTEIEEALAALGNGPSGIVLLQCVSQYPTQVEHVNLRAMETMRREFDHLVGLSDHTPGIVTAIAGAVLGACVVEKHITLARAMPGTDHAAALEEEGLRRLVRDIRVCARAMGDGRKEFDPVASTAAKKLGRSLTNRVAIPKGSTLTEEILILKSPGTGLLWRDRGRLLGKRAKRDIPADVILRPEDFG